MPRIASTQAYQLRQQVHALRAEGLSLRQIQQRLGFSSIASVQNYLASPLPSLDPAVVVDAALALKAKRRDFGPHQVLDSLAGQLGFDRNAPPLSCVALSRLFDEHNLKAPQITRRGANKPLYWLCDYDRPGKAYQVDTVKVQLASGTNVELMTVIDVVSRAFWAEYLPKGGSRAWVLKRAFDALGVPDVISTDNGFGFNLDTLYQLSDAVAYCFERGVREVHFIPVSSPWHNSIVERVHKTLKRGAWAHDGRQRVESVDEVPIWLDEYLSYYNTVKTHHALGKGNYQRTTPAQYHGSYAHLPVAAHISSFRPKSLAGHTGVVSYTRRIDSRGFAYVSAPGMIFDISSSAAFGHFARFSLDVSNGCGLVTVFDEDAATGVPVARQVGTFQHELGSDVRTNGYMRVTLLSGVVFEPRPFDEIVAAEDERKRLKTGLRAPNRLPSGHMLDRLPGGGWLLKDRYGRVVRSHQQLVVDHFDEEYGNLFE